MGLVGDGAAEARGSIGHGNKKFFCGRIKPRGAAAAVSWNGSFAISLAAGLWIACMLATGLEGGLAAAETDLSMEGRKPVRIEHLRSLLQVVTGIDASDSTQSSSSTTSLVPQYSSTSITQAAPSPIPPLGPGQLVQPGAPTSPATEIAPITPGQPPPSVASGNFAVIKDGGGSPSPSGPNPVQLPPKLDFGEGGSKSNFILDWEDPGCTMVLPVVNAQSAAQFSGQLQAPFLAEIKPKRHDMKLDGGLALGFKEDCPPTSGQLEAFLGQAKFLGNHDQGRIKHPPVTAVIEEQGKQKISLKIKGLEASFLTSGPLRVLDGQFGVAFTVSVDRGSLEIYNNTKTSRYQLTGLGTQAVGSGSIVAKGAAGFVEFANIAYSFDTAQLDEKLSLRAILKFRANITTKIDLPFSAPDPLPQSVPTFEVPQGPGIAQGIPPPPEALPFSLHIPLPGPDGNAGGPPSLQQPPGTIPPPQFQQPTPLIPANAVPPSPETFTASQSLPLEGMQDNEAVDHAAQNSTGVSSTSTAAADTVEVLSDDETERIEWSVTILLSDKDLVYAALIISGPIIVVAALGTLLALNSLCYMPWLKDGFKPLEISDAHNDSSDEDGCDEDFPGSEDTIDDDIGATHSSYYEHTVSEILERGVGCAAAKNYEQQFPRQAAHNGLDTQRPTITFEDVFCAVPNRQSLFSCCNQKREQETMWEEIDFDSMYNVDGKSYRIILHPVRGALRCGEMTVVLGPEGAGKTTFLNVLSGSLMDVDRDAIVKGNVYTGLPGHKQNENFTIGCLRRERELLNFMTVGEALAYAALLRSKPGTSVQDIKISVRRAAEELRLKQIMNKHIGGRKGLNDSQRRKVMIACEVALDPDVIVMDEPASGLDSHEAKDVLRSCWKISQSGRIVVMSVSQPSNDIVDLADSLLLLARGHPVFNGPVCQASSFFNQLGWPCSADYTLSQHMMRIVSRPDALAQILKSSRTNLFVRKCKGITVTSQSNIFRSGDYQSIDNTDQYEKSSTTPFGMVQDPPSVTPSELVNMSYPKSSSTCEKLDGQTDSFSFIGHGMSNHNSGIFGIIDSTFSDKLGSESDYIGDRVGSSFDGFANISPVDAPVTGRDQDETPSRMSNSISELPLPIKALCSMEESKNGADAGWCSAQNTHTISKLGRNANHRNSQRLKSNPFENCDEDTLIPGSYGRRENPLESPTHQQQATVPILLPTGVSISPSTTPRSGTPDVTDCQKQYCKSEGGNICMASGDSETDSDAADPGNPATVIPLLSSRSDCKENFDLDADKIQIRLLCALSSSEKESRTSIDVDIAERNSLGSMTVSQGFSSDTVNPTTQRSWLQDETMTCAPEVNLGAHGASWTSMDESAKRLVSVLSATRNPQHQQHASLDAERKHDSIDSMDSAPDFEKKLHNSNMGRPPIHPLRNLERKVELGNGLPKLRHNTTESMATEASVATPVKIGSCDPTAVGTKAFQNAKPITLERMESGMSALTVASTQPLFKSSEMNLWARFTSSRQRFAVETALLYWRSLNYVFRKFSMLAAHALVAVGFGCLLSLLFFQVNSGEDDLKSRSCAVFLSLAFLSLGGIASALAATEQRTVAVQEMRSKCYRVISYIIGDTAVEFLVLHLVPVGLLAAILMLVVGLQTSLLRAVILIGGLTVFSAAFVAMVLWILSLKRWHGFKLAAILVITLYGPCVCGFFIPKFELPWFVRPLHYASPFSVAFEAILISEFSGVESQIQVDGGQSFQDAKDQHSFYSMGLDADHLLLDVIVAVAFYCGFLVLNNVTIWVKSFRPHSISHSLRQCIPKLLNSSEDLQIPAES